ncbi:MAG TPA: TRAM domain-containing protein [Gemmatimonadota bacterium]|nr:TRAM domain-containing protein [Gemmatimonadota bacterium]
MNDGRSAPDGGTREIIELQIDAIAAGGDGVGRDDAGRVTFVPLTAPGDRVRAEITTAKARWARGRMLELLTAAPDRREAPCPVFGVCGGCRLQHLPPERQVTAKRAVVAAALRRIGGLEIEVSELRRPGEPLGYRNRVTLTIRGGRSGFHGLHDPDEIVDCPNCLLAEKPVREAWDALAPWTALPGGGELRVTIRASAAGRIALLVEGGQTPGDREAVADRLPNLESYLWIDESGTPLLLGGRAWFGETWQDIHYDLDPRVFLQVNRAAAAAMDEWLAGRLATRLGRGAVRFERGPGGLEGLRVADLYAGVAARPIRWARAGATVATCEIDPMACEAARVAAGNVGADIDVVEGRAEDHLELMDADLVVVNPPRAGLARPVRAALAAGPARAIAYVSCDPATLARDLQALCAVEGPYRIVTVQPFDAFPQTAHVETIAWLERREESAMPDPADEADDAEDADEAEAA